MPLFYYHFILDPTMFHDDRKKTNIAGYKLLQNEMCFRHLSTDTTYILYKENCWNNILLKLLFSFVFCTH